MLQTYYHREKCFTLRSIKTVENYERDGKLPEPRSKTKEKGKEIINDDKEVNVSMLFLNIKSQHLY